MTEQAIREFGRIDILVNNAGITSAGRGKTLPELTDEEWRVGIDVNLTTAFYCSRAIIEHFLEHGGGKIINVTSGWGMRGGRGNFMYSVAKGGVIQLTKALAMTYARDNIRCTCIAPGLIPKGIPDERRSEMGRRPARRPRRLPLRDGAALGLPRLRRVRLHVGRDRAARWRRDRRRRDARRPRPARRGVAEPPERPPSSRASTRA